MNTPQTQMPLILVLDDDNAILLAIAEMAAKTFPGHECVTTSLWMDASRILHTHRARKTVLISDMNMPGINGAEFCRIVRRNYPAVRIIIMSGEEIEVVRAKVTLSDITVLHKRSGRVALAEAIRQALT